jgi:hypothetical protein
MPISDADKLVEQLDLILAGMPAAEREVMKEWARREMVTHPVVTLATKKTWVDGWTEERDGKSPVQHPSGYRSLTWNVGHQSPQNPEAIIFAMMIVDLVHVHVFSFAPVADEEGQPKDRVIWFKEVIFQPDTTFGPVAGEALFMDWARLLQSDEEYEEFLAGREDKDAPQNGAGARASGGGAS